MRRRENLDPGAGSGRGARTPDRWGAAAPVAALLPARRPAIDRQVEGGGETGDQIVHGTPAFRGLPARFDDGAAAGGDPSAGTSRRSADPGY